MRCRGAARAIRARFERRPDRGGAGEGVDEAADLIAVTDLGAGLVQGRFFALPQPGEGITAWSPLLGGELTLPEDRWERARTIAAWLHERSSEV